MFSDLINKMKPIIPSDIDEWNNVSKKCHRKFFSNEPELFWYLSSGLDWKALVHFNNRDTTENYRTPNIDFFFYSDYLFAASRLDDLYEKLDFGETVLYEDFKTQITLEQGIPLKFFEREELESISSAFLRHDPASKDASFLKRFYEDLPKLKWHFFYCNIRIESNYFGEAFFPVFISPFDNWFLKNNVFSRNQIYFRYICSVCDGCGKGCAYKCAAEHCKDFFPIMKKDKRFWICDHIHKKISDTDVGLSCDEFNKTFFEVAELWNWGGYSGERRFGRRIDISKLYEIRTLIHE